MRGALRALESGPRAVEGVTLLSRSLIVSETIAGASQGKVSSISRIHFDVKNKENKDTRRNVNELTTIKKIVMICEKFEPKNDVKTRMKNMRARAALVREPPKPHRPVLTLRTLERGKNTFFPRLAHRSHRSTCTRIFPSDSSQNNIKICGNVSS